MPRQEGGREKEECGQGKGHEERKEEARLVRSRGGPHRGRGAPGSPSGKQQDLGGQTAVWMGPGAGQVAEDRHRGTLQPVGQRPEAMLLEGGRGWEERPSAELAVEELAGVTARRSWLPAI